MKNDLKIENLKDLVDLAKCDIKKAAEYELESDDCNLAKEIYSCLFGFYCEKDFSGDIIFTWKSPSLVEDGTYIGRRDNPIDNKRVIGNLFPNHKSNKKYSLNINRNSNGGSFPHDFFDIYLDHVAKYAYNEDRPKIMEYYPLKRAILYENNKKFFAEFNNFEDFLEKNYFSNIYSYIRKTEEQPSGQMFLDMKFDDFKEVSNNLMHERGILMLKTLIKKFEFD